MRRRQGAILSLVLLASLVPATKVNAAASRANLQKEVDGLTTQISTLDEDYNDARIKLVAAEQQMRELGVAKDDANRELAELRKTASQRAAASYRLGVPNMILALFGSENFTDFSRRMGVSSRVGDWESGIVTELEIANTRSQEKEEQLRQERDRAKSLSTSISKKRSALQERVNQHEALMSRIAAEERARAAASRRSTPPAPLHPAGSQDRNSAPARLRQRPGCAGRRLLENRERPTPGVQAVPDPSTARASRVTHGGRQACRCLTRRGHSTP